MLQAFLTTKRRSTVDGATIRSASSILASNVRVRDMAGPELTKSGGAAFETCLSFRFGKADPILRLRGTVRALFKTPARGTGASVRCCRPRQRIAVGRVALAATGLRLWYRFAPPLRLRSKTLSMNARRIATRWRI